MVEWNNRPFRKNRNCITGITDSTEEWTVEPNGLTGPSKGILV